MLKPLGNRVIIQKSEQEQTTKSGIVLTDRDFSLALSVNTIPLLVVCSCSDF
jgi:co-chaperonin GroES (HSP10)